MKLKKSYFIFVVLLLFVGIAGGVFYNINFKTNPIINTGIEKISSANYKSVSYVGNIITGTTSSSNYKAIPLSNQILTQISDVNNKPVAVITVSNNYYINDNIILDGRNSYDPDSDVLTYLWTPIDTTINIVNSNDSVASFSVNKSGNYTFGLTVTDPTGETSYIEQTYSVLDIYFEIIQNNYQTVNINSKTNYIKIKFSGSDNNIISGNTLQYSISSKPAGDVNSYISDTISYSDTEKGCRVFVGNKTGQLIIKITNTKTSKVLYATIVTEQVTLENELWSMWTAMKNITNSDVKTFFANNNITDYLIYIWDENASVDEYGSKYKEPVSISAGKSYWIKIKGDSTQTTNLAISGTENTDTVNVTLNAGWNQIGNPFSYNVNWKDCKIKYNEMDYTPAAAESANIIQNKIYWYFKDQANVYEPNNLISYEDVQLKPWFGNWVYSYKTCILQIPAGYVNPNDTNLENTPSKLAPGLASETNWEIKIKAVSANLKDEYSFIGVKENSVDGHDNNDIFEAPLVNDYINVSFKQNISGQKAPAYVTTDYKKKIETFKIWNFDVISSSPNRNINLDLSEMKLPVNYAAYLFDGTNYIDLNKQQSYDFNIGKTAKKSFIIKVGDKKYSSIMLATGIVNDSTYVYPNPAYVNQGQKPKFKITTGSIITNFEIKIFDISGEQVLEKTNPNLMSGIIGVDNAVIYEWNAENGSGKKVASGTYLAIVKVDTNNGSYKLKYKVSIIR